MSADFFELEDDDLWDDTLRSIPDSDLIEDNLSGSFSNKALTGCDDSQIPSAQSEVSNEETNCSSSSKKISEQLAESETISDPSEEDTDNKDYQARWDWRLGVWIREKRKCSSAAIEMSEKQEAESGATSSDYPNDDDFQALIDWRFIPGYTPRRATPADIFDSWHIPNELLRPAERLGPSWKVLQMEVCNFPPLLGTVKFYSIRRVLHEASRLKLPKHLEVPTLCVFIKYFNPRTAFYGQYEKTKSVPIVFMDDTGQVDGRVDKDVVAMYEEEIQIGTALILKNVTFLCNVLLLKKTGLVSLCLPDGSVKEVQELSSAVDAGHGNHLKAMFSKIERLPIFQRKTNPVSHVETHPSNIRNAKAVEKIRNFEQTAKRPCIFPNSVGAGDIKEGEDFSNMFAAADDPVSEEEL